MKGRAAPAIALTLCTGLVATAGLAATAVLTSAAPSAAVQGDLPGAELLREWTGAKGAAVGTGLAAESCDFTGDGKDDILASAWLWDRTPYGDIGAVYVIPNGAESGQLDDPTTGITRIEGPQKLDISVGFRLACAGDVNGDGFEDVLIDEGESSRVWVVFGDAEPENIALEFLGDRGFVIDRADDVDAGYDTQLVSLGDLDGDGFDDIGILSPRANGGAGQVTVVKGRDDIATVHTENDDEVLMRLNNAGVNMMRLASAGDVNGDGVNDLIVSAPDARTEASGRTYTGVTWMVSGTSRGDVDLTGEFDGFRVEGPAAVRNRLGLSLASVGDVNGDGFADFMIGGPGLSVQGGAAVVLGSDSNETVFTDPTAENGSSVFSGSAEGSAEGSVDRGWWIHDSSSGASNLLGFTVGADAARSDRVGTLVISEFIKHFAVAMPTSVLGEDAVIDIAELSADQKVTYDEGQKYLGRTIGVVHQFGSDSCTQLALGGDGNNGDGSYNLYAVPWSESALCEAIDDNGGSDSNADSNAGGSADSSAGGSADSSADSNAGSDSDSDSDSNGGSAGSSEGGANSGVGADSNGTSPQGDADALPNTGAQIGGWVACAGLLLLIGAALTIQARRKTQ